MNVDKKEETTLHLSPKSEVGLNIERKVEMIRYIDPEDV